MGADGPGRAYAECRAQEPVWVELVLLAQHNELGM